MLGYVKLFHHSLMLLSFIWIFFFFELHFGYFFAAMSLGSLIFSSAVSNLLLIPSNVLFHLRHCKFHLQKFELGLLKFSSMSLLHHLNRVLTTVLMFLSASSNICIHSGLVSTDYSLHCGSCLLFFECLVIFVWMLDIVHFTLSGTEYFCLYVNNLYLFSGMLLFRNNLILTYVIFTIH